jgi:hypothetical protein
MERSIWPASPLFGGTILRKICPINERPVAVLETVNASDLFFLEECHPERMSSREDVVTGNVFIGLGSE